MEPQLRRSLLAAGSLAGKAEAAVRCARCLPKIPSTGAGRQKGQSGEAENPRARPPGGDRTTSPAKAIKSRYVETSRGSRRSRFAFRHEERADGKHKVGNDESPVHRRILVAGHFSKGDK